MDNCIVDQISKEELISQLNKDWEIRLGNLAAKTYWNDIVKKINASIAAGHLVMPSLKRVFAALNNTPMDKFRVLLIGQDPYPAIGVATGYAFSTFKDDYIQDSLERIFMEIDKEYGSNMAKTHKTNGSLLPWTKQGVMLLNPILTTGGFGDMHKSCKWNSFTREVIEYLDNNYKFVTLAFGSDARKAAEVIINNKELVIAVGHPSPRNTTTPFIGSNCFAKCNDLLIKNSLLPINWVLPK